MLSAWLAADEVPSGVETDASAEERDSSGVEVATEDVVAGVWQLAKRAAKERAKINLFVFIKCIFLAITFTLPKESCKGRKKKNK